mgnify:CR=1 FL=1
MKVVVGQNTIVKKITVGTPLRVGSAANGSLTGLDDVNSTTGLAHGTLLQYDSATGKFNHVPATTIAGPDIHATFDSSAIGTLTFNDSTGAVRLVGPTTAQIRALFSAHPSANNILQYDSTAGTFHVETQSLAFDSNFAGKTTDDLAEGSNLYFTDSRGRAAIGVTDNGVGFGSLTYNSASGQITYTGTSVANMRSVINVGSNLAYDSATGKITFTGSLGGDFDAGDAQQSISVVNDNGDYGSLAYDNGSGVFTFTKVTDSDIRGSISVAGDLVYDQASGVITYNKRTDADIRSLFSGSNDVTYDPNTGVIDVSVGAHYGDSDARNVFSVNFVGDTAFDSSPYGGASYDASTGVLTINGTTDSNIRNSLTVQDSGGLGSLTYNTKQGRIVYTGPGVSDVSSLLSATTDSLSMGKLTLDSSKGQFTLKLEDDSVRALFSVVSDQEGGANLTYDQATGVFTHSGPSDLDLRGKVSASDQGGDGSFTYDESSGVFTYTGPSPAEVRAHFEGGLGIDYIESTGTFRLDSSANIVTGSIVTGNLTVSDSATINVARVEDTLFVDSIRSSDSSIGIGLTGLDVELKATNRILFDAPFLHATDNRLVLSVEDQDSNNWNYGGIFLGDGPKQQFFTWRQDINQWRLSTGLNVPGPLTGETIDSINKRIDELPDSAQMKGILSAGPGLSYDNVNGIYRITSSGVVAGTYGDATNVPRFAVDSLGQIDSINLIPISTVNNFQFDSTSGNLKITTATDSYNVGITLDPYSTNDLVEGSNNLYYTRARFDSALDDSTSETRIRQYFRTDLASDSSRQQVRKYFNAGPSLTYDSATGKFTTNQALDSNSNVRFQNITQSGQLRGPAEFIIDPAAIGDNTGTVKILGNLQVEGTQTIINSTTVSVNDKNLVLGDSAADSSALHGAGITLGGTNIVDKPSFTYSHADKRFVFNRNIQADSFYGDVTGNVTGNVVGDVIGNVTGQVSDISNHNTDSLAEGSTNLYFTVPRVRSSLSVVDAGGDGSFVYDSAAGQFTYTGPSPAETRQHLNVLDAGGDGSFTYDSAAGKFTYTGPSPTEARAHFQVNDTGGDGSLTYDSATGTFTYTGPSEAEFYQHLKNNHDSFGDLVFDSTYGSKGGFALHTRHILKHREVYADSFINNQEYFLMYSGTTGGELVKVRADTLASKIGGGGGGGAGGGLLSFVNL